MPPIIKIKNLIYGGTNIEIYGKVNDKLIIDEKMIEMLMSGMGRKASKEQVNQMMKQIKQSM